MDDLISRQAAINALDEYLEEYDGLDDRGLHSEKWCAMSEAKMTIETLSAVQRVESVGMRWIPCAEAEPEEDQECWITVKTTDTIYRGDFTRRYGERRDKGFITTGGFMWWNTALAWMPIIIPEPWKGEG